MDSPAASILSWFEFASLASASCRYREIVVCSGWHQSRKSASARFLQTVQ